MTQATFPFFAPIPHHLFPGSKLKYRFTSLLVCTIAALVIGCDAERPPVEPQLDPDPIPLAAWHVTSFSSEATIQSILAADSGLVLVGTWGDGLFRSIDSGVTWEGLADGVTDDVLSIAGTAGGAILLGAENGIYRSTDQGDSWSQSLNTSLVRSVWSGANNELLAVATYGGIYRSTDDGIHWIQLSPTTDDRYICAINSDGGCFFVGTFSGLFRSTDVGATWIKVLSAGGICYNMAMGAAGTVFAPTWGQLYRSSDEGSSWIPGGTTPSIGTIAVSDNGMVFLGTNQEGILVSNDNGDTWLELNSGLTSLEIRSLAIDPDGFVYAGTWLGGGLFKTVEPVAAIPVLKVK